MSFQVKIYFHLFFSVDGKFGISKTGLTTVKSTRTHAQGESELCWLYSISTSLKRSLKLNIGKGFKVYKIKTVPKSQESRESLSYLSKLYSIKDCVPNYFK